MKHTNLYLLPLIFFVLLFTSCNNESTSIFEDDFTCIDTRANGFTPTLTSDQKSDYEGLWKIENNCGIKALLLTDGIIKEKDVDESSFSEFATYEECGNIIIQDNGKSIAVTILELTPSMAKQKPDYLYWGVYTSEINGIPSINVYTFNGNPLHQDSYAPISSSCYSKVGEVYLSKKKQNNNRDVPTANQIWLYSMCSTNAITLVYFHALWSGLCKLQTPIVNSFADDYYEELGYCIFNIDSVPEICLEYNIDSVPTCLFLETNAFVLARITGFTTRTNLELVYSALKSE